MTFLLLLSTLPLFGQIPTELAGQEFRYYEKNRVNFLQIDFFQKDFITKLKGKTINGEDIFDKPNGNKYRIKIIGDTIFTFNQILERPIEKITLLTVSDSSFKATIENQLIPVPPHLKNEKKKTYEFINKDFISKNKGADLSICITNFNLFRQIDSDSTNNKLEYIGFENLIEKIQNCGTGANYSIESYVDIPYQILLPKTLSIQSFGFGDDSFYIRYDSEAKEDIDLITMQIDYDFSGKLSKMINNKLLEEKAHKEAVNEKEIIITKNWQGKKCGYAFYENNIVISYYCNDGYQTENLKNCITSMKKI